ncbi:MAG: hypothetical protein KOO65_05420 [Desulfobacterales bacterium]|nr:hypothetical protein [Desulfobacterales bacterium]
MKEKKVKPLYNLEKNLIFLKETKDGEFAEIEQSSFEYLRTHIDAQYINTDTQEYYHSFSS